MTSKEVLQRTRALISDPDRWCQEAAALDKNGKTVLPCDINAARWCVSGAYQHVCGDHYDLPGWIDLADAALDYSGHLKGPGRVNDEDGHAAILKVLDQAIERCHS